MSRRQKTFSIDSRGWRELNRNYETKFVTLICVSTRSHDCSPLYVQRIVKTIRKTIKNIVSTNRQTRLRSFYATRYREKPRSSFVNSTYYAKGKKIINMYKHYISNAENIRYRFTYYTTINVNIGIELLKGQRRCQFPTYPKIQTSFPIN